MAMRIKVGPYWQRIGTQEQAEQVTARYDCSETCNPAGVMLTKAEVVAAAALIAFIVTFVTAHVLDRWGRY